LYHYFFVLKNAVSRVNFFFVFFARNHSPGMPITTAFAGIYSFFAKGGVPSIAGDGGFYKSKNPNPSPYRPPFTASLAQIIERGTPFLKG
jgi:hypothetical protein